MKKKIHFSVTVWSPTPCDTHFQKYQKYFSFPFGVRSYDTYFQVIKKYQKILKF